MTESKLQFRTDELRIGKMMGASDIKLSIDARKLPLLGLIVEFAFRSYERTVSRNSRVIPELSEHANYQFDGRSSVS